MVRAKRIQDVITSAWVFDNPYQKVSRFDYFGEWFNFSGYESSMKPSKHSFHRFTFLTFHAYFCFFRRHESSLELSDGGNCVEYGYMQGIATAGMVFGILLSVGGAYKIRNLSKDGKETGGSQDGDGETPSVKYSEDGYWKLIEESGFLLKKQMSATNSGSHIPETKIR